jgi:tyrosine-protein kinase Etk/Wzc
MKSNKKTLSDYFAVLMKWRYHIIANVFIITLLAIIISLIIPVKYTATATLLPPNPEQEAMFGFIPGLTPGGISAGFSSVLTGMVTGVSTISDLYTTIMTSSRIKRVIIDKYNLRKVLKAKTIHDAFLALDKITETEISPEGIISIKVTHRDKYLATNIANSYVEELDKFNTETAMTVGKKYRMFIEERLEGAEDTLAQAEEALRAFQEKYHTVSLDVEIQAAIETIVQLKSQIILHEVQKGAWSAAGQADNPYLYNINRDLRELRKQLSKIEFGKGDTTMREFGAGFSVPFSELPEVSLEYARLFRDVKIQEAIFELLTQQYENARIMEVKDTPTVQFLDEARVPEKKSWPRRTLIVLFAFFFSIIASIPLVFLIEYIGEVKAKPAEHPYATRFFADVSGDFSKIRLFVQGLFKRKKH